MASDWPICHRGFFFFFSHRGCQIFLKHFYNRHGRHPDIFNLIIKQMECINHRYADWLHLCIKTISEIMILLFAILLAHWCGSSAFLTYQSNSMARTSSLLAFLWVVIFLPLQPRWLPLLMLTTHWFFRFPSHTVCQTIFCMQTKMHKGWCVHQLNVTMAHRECYCAALVSRLTRTRTSNTIPLKRNLLLKLIEKMLVFFSFAWSWKLSGGAHPGPSLGSHDTHLDRVQNLILSIDHVAVAWLVYQHEAPQTDSN